MYESKNKARLFADSEGAVVEEGSPYAATPLLEPGALLSNEAAEKLIKERPDLTPYLVKQPDPPKARDNSGGA